MEPHVPASSCRLKVAIVAPSLRILGGQSIQADRLLAAWRDDPEVEAWLVPVNPLPPPALQRLVQVKYLRTLVTEALYVPLLIRELARAGVIFLFSARSRSSNRGGSRARQAGHSELSQR
jgi:hypothetical protein